MSNSSHRGSVSHSAFLGQSFSSSARHATGESVPSISSRISPIVYSSGVRHSLYPPPLPLTPTISLALTRSFTIISRYFLEIFCLAAISLRGMNLSDSFSAISSITRIAYLPLVVIITYSSLLLVMKYYSIYYVAYCVSFIVYSLLPINLLYNRLIFMSLY